VWFAGVKIADSRNAKRVLETSHPPVYYIPPEDLCMEHLRLSHRRASWCEWKGQASYYDVEANGKEAPAAAWTYRRPSPVFAAIADHIAFYPGRMEACFVDGECVQPQEGDFYGGWITSEIVGPFKGIPATRDW
jgi:uncharacterized protein (DUF427 family)